MPACRDGRRSVTRIPRWLNPARPPGNGPHWGAHSPACPPKCPPARSLLTLLPRSLTVPLCTVRIEHPAARPWPGVRSRLSPACWLVYRTCRIAGVACARTYAQLCITFHDSARAYVAAAIAAQGFHLAHRARSALENPQVQASRAAPYQPFKYEARAQLGKRVGRRARGCWQGEGSGFTDLSSCAVRACEASEAAARPGRPRFFLSRTSLGFPPGCWLKPPLQEREHAVQEELALGRIEVELVLVTQQRLGGWEGRGCPARRPAHAGRRRPPAR